MPDVGEGNFVGRFVLAGYDSASATLIDGVVQTDGSIKVSSIGTANVTVAGALSASLVGPASISLYGSSSVSLYGATSVSLYGASSFSLLGTISSDIVAIGTIYNGVKNVSSNIAEIIAATQVIRSVTVKAMSTNSSAVYLGASTVTTANGMELLAGESVSLDVNNLNLVYVTAGTNSQVVRYLAI
jgi:hypothetical protein